MNKFHKLALCAAVSLASGLTAATAISQEAAAETKVSALAATQANSGAAAIAEADVKELNESTDKKVQRSGKASKSPRYVVDKKIKDFLKEKHLRPGGTQNKNNKVVFYKVVNVDANKASSDFVRHIELAYERAYLDALGDFSKFLARKVSVEIVKEFFGDDSSNAGEFKDNEGDGVSKIEAIGQKILALTEAQLDVALQKAGVDPSEYASRPKDQKALLLNDVFLNKVKHGTSMQMSGITILDNFISIDDKGEAAVGVILMQSPVTQNLALCLKHSTPPNLTALGAPLEDQLPMDEEAKMSDLFGTRLLIDEKGPVVVSFGFWSVKKSNNPSIQGRLVTAAEKQANSVAESQLAQFLALSFTSEGNDVRGNSMSSSAVKNGETGAVSPEVVEKTVQSIVEEKSRLKSKVNLSGVRNILNWEYEDPDDGKLTVGVVLAYSMSSIDEAMNIKNRQKKTLPTAEPKTAPAGGSKSEEAVSRKSAVTTALDVF